MSVAYVERAQDAWPEADDALEWLAEMWSGPMQPDQPQPGPARAASAVKGTRVGGKRSPRVKE